MSWEVSKSDGRRRWSFLALGGALVAFAWAWTPADAPELPPWQRYTPPAMAFNVAATALLAAAVLVFHSGHGIARRAARATAVALAFVLAVAVLEAPAVVLGHDYRRTLGTLGPEGALGVPLQANRLDPELIHIHHPTTRIAGRVRGNLAPMGIPGEPHAFDVTYDSRGFRNERDHDRADVVIVGDSFVEAALVPLDETLPRRIELATGRPCVNLGQAAYGPQQELAVLRRFGLPLAPEVVVWCFFGGNDLRDAHYYEELRAGFETLESKMTVPLVERLFTTNAIGRLKSELAMSALSERARRRSGLFVDSSEDERRVFFSRSEGPWEPEPLETTLAALDEAARLCDQAGVRLLLLYIPRKFRVYDGLCRFEEDSLCRSWTSNDLPEVLRRWCGERAVLFEDTTPALRARVTAGEHVYFVDDVHWNPAGHEVAAGLVLGRLAELGWSFDREDQEVGP